MLRHRQIVEMIVAESNRLGACRDDTGQALNDELFCLHQPWHGHEHEQRDRRARGTRILHQRRNERVEGAADEPA